MHKMLLHISHQEEIIWQVTHKTVYKMYECSARASPPTTVRWSPQEAMEVKLGS